MRSEPKVGYVANIKDGAGRNAPSWVLCKSGGL